jgi:hypothetical protein
VARLNYGKLVRDDTFIGRYLAYMSVQETPTAYDFWCALWLMSIAVGRECVVARPRAPVYLNIYTMLVAESGVTRKSTSVRMATHVARLFMEKHDNEYELVQTKTSPEQLEWRLHNLSNQYGTAKLAISISELVTFLGREKYNLAMPGLLTDLYDAPHYRVGGGTISRGQSILRKVFVSFLSATTPSWLTRAINPDVIEGGFTSRVLFIHEEQRKRKIAWPDADTAGQEEKTNTICDGLAAIRAHVTERGITEINISDTALKRFTAWYRTRAESRDPFRASFESREDGHVLRVAAFLAINDGAWLIQANHVSHAIAVIAQVKEDGAKIFAGAGATSKIVLGIDKLRDVLIETGLDGATQSVLTTRVRAYMDAAKLRTTLDILHELGMVQKFETLHAKIGRPKTIWRATNTLIAPGAVSAIMDKMEPDR